MFESDLLNLMVEVQPGLGPVRVTLILERLRIRTCDLEFILKGRPQSDDVNKSF